MNNYPLVWIVIGVSGSGKTTIGRLWSQQLECQYIEGDRLHSKQSILKMLTQQPLQDEDRHQWLHDIECDIQEAIDRNREMVITCSALKAKYRQQLIFSGRVQLIWIDVPIVILEKRLAARQDHFMNAEMLASQIAAFETITSSESIITIDGNQPIDAVMNELKTKIIQQFPAMEKPWWERGME